MTVAITIARVCRQGQRIAMLGLTAVAVIAIAAPVVAQGTDQEREACTPDVFRLCSSEIPNVDRIVQCLNRERPRLSPGCRAVMTGDPHQGKTRAARSERSTRESRE